MLLTWYLHLLHVFRINSLFSIVMSLALWHVTWTNTTASQTASLSLVFHFLIHPLYRHQTGLCKTGGFSVYTFLGAPRGLQGKAEMTHGP